MGLWEKFWSGRDGAFLIPASIAGGVAYGLIGLWALQEGNPLAMVLDLMGAGTADGAYRLMGAEKEGPSGTSLTLALASWLLPIAAVALLVFFPGARGR